MTLNPTMTIREIVLELPFATRVFERMNIDYCCGGDRLLGEACASAGLELESLERLLSEAAREGLPADAEIDFPSLSLTKLINHILEKHHVYTKRELARLSDLMARVIDAHGVNHPELQHLGRLFHRLCADLALHMHKEEEILFPYIIEMEKAELNKQSLPPSYFGTVNNPVRMMSMEHDAAGDLLRALRKQSSDYAIPTDGCISYQTLYLALDAFEKDLHQHVHLENNILFPRAIAMERGGLCR